MRSWTAVVSVVWAFGCGSSDDSGGTPSSGGTGTGGSNEGGDTGATAGSRASGGNAGSRAAEVTDLCQRFAEAYCQHVALCGCGGAAAERCLAESTTSCLRGESFFTPLENAVASGELGYHPEAVEGVLAPLEDPEASCGGLFLALGLDSVAAHTFGGVFTGSKALGETCRLPVDRKGGISDCTEGLGCIPGADGLRCVALVGTEEACDIGDSPTRICFERRPPDSDSEYESAFDNLSCVPDAPGGLTGTCANDVADGGPCASPGACASGRCVSIDVGTAECGPKLADGETCGDSRDCSSGACRDPYGNAPACSSPLEDGAPCGYDDDSCQSGNCNTPGAGSGTSPGVCGPDLQKPSGDPCTNNFECANDGRCLDGICLARVCQDF